ncbi:HK97 gp10 family phage protein [Halobacillus sp. A5]|uniref:HK97 gp10 family phage protein n=1 Tax=Halobacillus sp. A5 TaxID=2880263 RepID=UPI0020A65937|nr:HK97 gp10 family phage protein [Halobacillus sp. A5]MCP3026605.1 hypothetical protein [Halobacillus sp. A5]
MAKSDNLLEIEWEGLVELDEEFEKMEEEFEEILVEEYTKYGLLVEEGAKALAHRDDGDLEETIRFNPAEVEADSVSVEGGANAEHALVRHEAPYRPGTHDKYENGSKFKKYYLNGRGRKTLRKPDWRGYRPGRKFLENAIKATENDYYNMNERILDRTLGEKK